MKRPGDADWDEFHDDEIVDWKRVRSAIEHENELTNHRLTWLLTSQGFLFAAFALIFQASTKTDVKDELRIFYYYILAGFAATGIIISFYLWLLLQGAEIQHEKLRTWWLKRPKDDFRHPSICGDPKWTNRIFPTSGLTFLFVVSWIIFIVVTLNDLIKPYANIIVQYLFGALVVIGSMILGAILYRFLWITNQKKR